MSEFSQNGIISTLHDFGTRSTSEIEKDLLKFSKERKMELILPCLYSELEGSALPNIVEEISKTKYLDHIIVGLDRANENQAKKAWKFFKKLKNPFSISFVDLVPKSCKVEIIPFWENSLILNSNHYILFFLAPFLSHQPSPQEMAY